AGQVGAARLAEAADLAVDDAGILYGDLLVADAVALQGAGPEVGDHDVGALAEPACELQVAGVLEVEHERALVAVRGVEVRGTARRIDRRLPGPGVVAAGRLDLDHVRAEVAERHADERPREDAGEVGDEQPVECGHAKVTKTRLPLPARLAAIAASTSS